MHPILFEIGTFKIPAYGASLLLAFVIAMVLLKKEAPKQGLDPNQVGDVAIAGLLFGLIGAKLLLILVDLPEYLSNPRRILTTLRSAGVIYGGLIGGTAGIVWYLRRYRLPVWKTLDLMAPFAALGAGVGRLSCIMAGCCHGFPYDGPFSLIFPDDPYCEAPAGIGLFPVQLVGMINGILLFFLLRWMLRHKKTFDGQIILSYAFLYGLTRGLIEFLRGDTVRGIWLGGTISTSQLIGLTAMALAAILFVVRRKRTLT